MTGTKMSNLNNVEWVHPSLALDKRRW